MSGAAWGDAGSQPTRPYWEPLDHQDFGAQTGPARFTAGEMVPAISYLEAGERAEPGPLIDAELDEAIVRLVSLYPGRLGRQRIAHIIAGHRGRKIKAKYSHLPDYGRDPFVSVEQVRHHVARLLQTGRLDQRGDNPPRLMPAARARSRRRRGR